MAQCNGYCMLECDRESQATRMNERDDPSRVQSPLKSLRHSRGLGDQCSSAMERERKGAGTWCCPTMGYAAGGTNEGLTLRKQ